MVQAQAEAEFFILIPEHRQVFLDFLHEMFETSVTFVIHHAEVSQCHNMYIHICTNKYH